MTTEGRHRFPARAFKAASRGIPLAAALQNQLPPFAPRRPQAARETVPATSPRSAFTVLELVVVVGVLSVVLAVVLPTLKTVHAAALRKRAQAEATALAQAAIRYKTEYGFWPGQLKPKDEYTAELRDAFKEQSGLIHLIVSGPDTFTAKLNLSTGSDGESAVMVTLNTNEVCQSFRRVGANSGGTFKDNPLNPKGLQFLDLENESDPDIVNYPDPWGRSYVLFMGLNPRSTFTHTVSFPDGGSQVMRVDNTIAFALSFGPDGDRSTNYIYSAGVSNEP